MSMRTVLASGPVCWGVDFADSPSNPPWHAVLDGIAEAGYHWLELGPIGYLPEDVTRLMDELECRGLGIAAGFVFEPLHDPRELPRVLDVVRRTGRVLAEVGARRLIVIDLLAPERVKTAGRSDAARRLPQAERDALVASIEAVAMLARDEFELESALHPHAGTYVEFADEIDVLLGTIDPELVGLCIDTGHTTYAGIDPVALYERHADRVCHLHLKDVASSVLGRVRAERLDFESGVALGAFCPLGAGSVDFASLRVRLQRESFTGFATVEQDRRRSGSGDPVTDAAQSLAFLRANGFVDAGQPFPARAT